MKRTEKTQYSVSFTVEAIRLPPVSDILVLAKKHPQGKVGIMQAFQFIAPDEFELIPINEEDDTVEAVLVHKRILRKMSAAQLVDVLSELLLRSESDDVVFSDFRVRETGMRATVEAAGSSAAGEELRGPPIKAITYHGLRCEQAGAGWEVRVIFDV